MKYAIDRFVNNREGKEIEVSASDIYEEYGGGYVPRAQNRFFCPECQEKVFFRRKGSGEFYHQARTDFTPECDKRVDGNSDLYVYERTGLPIYLTHKYGDVYALNIAFPALGEQKLLDAFKNNVCISINNKTTIPVTPSRFYADEPTLIPIDFVPYDGKNYNITISGTGKYSIQKKWSDYADGFSCDAAIFAVHNNFAKKVKRGDSIIINKEYYLVAKNFQPLYSEIHSNKIGRIRLNGIDFSVYAFSVRTSVDSSRFSSICNYIYSKFKVWILEKAATITPVWPPIIDRGDQISFSGASTVYCDVNSGNNMPKVFAYSGKDVRQIPVSTDNKHNKTVKLTVYSYEPTVVSVDKKYTGRELSIRKAALPLIPHQDNYAILSNDGEEIGLSSPLDPKTLNNGITVKTDTKITVVTETKNHIYKVVPIAKEEFFLEPQKGLKQIIITQELSPSGYILLNSLTVNSSKKIIDIDEQQVINEIKKRCNGSLINAPLWTKELLYLCYVYGMPSLSETLKVALKNGQTYKTLVVYLKQLRRMLAND